MADARERSPVAHPGQSEIKVNSTRNARCDKQEDLEQPQRVAAAAAARWSSASTSPRGSSAGASSSKKSSAGSAAPEAPVPPQPHQPGAAVAIDMGPADGQQQAAVVVQAAAEPPKRMRKRSRVFLNPSDSFCYWWSAVVSLAFLYNFWSLSYRFAFREIDSTTWHIWFAFDYAADAIYLIDIFVNFRTGYLEDGVLQRDTNKIAAHYQESTLFYLDSSCLLPFDILYLSFGFCSIFRCNRLVKIHKFWSFVDRTERHTNYPNVFRTFTLVHYILVIFHWNACLFHMISKHKEIIDIETLFQISNNQCADISCQYLHAFYWSTLALTIIGGLPKPRARGEYIYVIVELFFGLFLFASVLGHVANIVTNVSAARKEFQARLDAVKTFMRTRRVSDDLQRKVIRWFDYLWISQKSSDEERSVACLPDRLKAEIAIHVNLDTLKRVDIFQATEAGFLRELVLRLKPVLFSPGDYVCRKDEAGHEMYIVSRGILEVVTNEGQTVVATFRAGSYFGEIAVLNVGSAGNKRTASVRSVGYSDLFCLSKQDLWDVLKDYPNAEARIRAVAEERLSALGGGNKPRTASSSSRRAPPWRRSSARSAAVRSSPQVVAGPGERRLHHSELEANGELDDDDDDEGPPNGTRRRVASSASSQFKSAKRASGRQKQFLARDQQQQHASAYQADGHPLATCRHSRGGSARLRQATSGYALCHCHLLASQTCACGAHLTGPQPYQPPGHHHHQQLSHHLPTGHLVEMQRQRSQVFRGPQEAAGSRLTQRSSLSSQCGLSQQTGLSFDHQVALQQQQQQPQPSGQNQLSVYGPQHLLQPHNHLRANQPPGGFGGGGGGLHIGQSRSFECTPSGARVPAALGYESDRSRSGCLAPGGAPGRGSSRGPLTSSDTLATTTTPEHSTGNSENNQTTTIREQVADARAANQNNDDELQQQQQQRVLPDEHLGQLLLEPQELYEDLELAAWHDGEAYHARPLADEEPPEFEAEPPARLMRQVHKETCRRRRQPPAGGEPAGEAREACQDRRQEPPPGGAGRAPSPRFQAINPSWEADSQRPPPRASRTADGEPEPPPEDEQQDEEEEEEEQEEQGRDRPHPP